MTTHQAEFHAEQWPELPSAEATALRTELGQVLEFYREHIGSPSKTRVHLDIGAGRGGLVAALRDAGHVVVGCEPSMGLCVRARSAYGLSADEMVCEPAEVFLDRVLQEKISVGHVFLWHVIEHLANPLDLMRRIASVLPPGHAVFVQAPCVKQSWLYPEHLVLFTEPAVHALARNIGCEVIVINYDHTLAFITFVLRRTDQPLARVWAADRTTIADDRAALEVELRRVRAQLESSEVSVRAAEALAVERYAAIEQQSAMIDDRGRAIEEQSKMIDDRDKWIAKLRQRVDELKDELARFRAQSRETQPKANE